MTDHIKLLEENPDFSSKVNVENSLNIQGLILNEEPTSNSNRRRTASPPRARPVIPETTYDSNQNRRNSDNESSRRRSPERSERRPERRRSPEQRERRPLPRPQAQERHNDAADHQDSFDDLDEDDRNMMEELANPEKKRAEEPIADVFKDDDAEDDEYPDFGRRHSSDHRDRRRSDSPHRPSPSNAWPSPHRDFGDDDKWGYQEPDMSPEEELKRKQELLEGFDKLSRKGVRIHRVFDINSDVRDMEAEYNRLLKQREIENSIKFQRKMLMAFVTGVEFLNNRYNPFDLDLDGWSEVVMSDVDNYDDIFEELYEKYHTKVNMAPELRLMFTLGGSAVMFHLTNTMFKSALPGMNPDMAKGMQKMAMGAMRGAAGNGGGGGRPPQGRPAPQGGFGGMFGGNAGSGPRNVPMPPRRPQPSQDDNQQHIRRTMRNGNKGPTPQPGVTTRQSTRREMRGPKSSDLDDILNDLNLPGDGDVGTDIEALLNSEESEEVKHISLSNRDGITLNRKK